MERNESCEHGKYCTVCSCLISDLCCWKKSSHCENFPTIKIYRDGELIDILEGNEMFIEVGKNIPLIAYYKIMIPSEYKIKGTVIYDGKETEGRGVSFTVPEQE